MYQVYILQSEKTHRYYIGSTQNVIARLEQHNARKVKSTKWYAPWKIIHTEDFNTRSEACKRERQIKSYKGGMAFKRLIETKKV